MSNLLIYLSGATEECISLSLVVNFELVDSVDVWDFKPSLVLPSPSNTLEVNTNKGINSNKVELNVLCTVAIPSSRLELLNDDVVDNVFRDNVGSGSVTLSRLVMRDVAETENSLLLEHPLTQSLGQVFVPSLSSLTQKQNTI